MSNYGTSNTISPSGINFIVQNNTSRNLTILGVQIGPGNKYDLFTSPDISEDDIKTSLLKGELKYRLLNNQITIISTTLNLPVLDPVFKSFLASKGVSTISLSGTTGITVDNISSLSTVSNPGTVVLAQVKTNLGYYIFDSVSTLTADGQYIINPPSGSGKWIRQFWGHDFYRQASTLYLDSVNGNDENDGITSGTPIKTFKETAFRLGGRITSTLTLKIISSTVTTDTADWLNLISAPGCNLIISAFTQPVTRTGTVTSATGGTGVEPTLTDSGVTTWTEIGSKVLLTSGVSSGAFAFVMKDKGSGTARLSHWFKGDFSALATVPSGGDTYAVINMLSLNWTGNPILPEVTSDSSQTSTVQLENLAISGSTATRCSKLLGSGCSFIVSFNAAGSEGVTLRGCYTPVYSSSGTSTITLTACGVKGAVQAFNGHSISATDLIVQGTGIAVSNGSVVVLTSPGIFDSAIALQVNNAKAALQTSWFGTGNTTVCLAQYHGLIRIIGGFVPTCTGVTEVNLEGGATAIPKLVAGASVPAASSLTTWAQWSGATFSKTAMNYATGSCIFAG